MFSVVEKLIGEDKKCLNAICHIFILENLKLKFYKIKDKIEQAKKHRTIKQKFYEMEK